MRHILHRIHEWATRSPVARFDDPVLGELVLNESSWRCTIESADGAIDICVGGRYEPDEGLLERTRKTVRHLDAFVNRVSTYLAHESKQETWRPFADEICSLIITDINYWWARSPSAGMIFFRSPDECKQWHCDINGSQLSGLAFDS